MSGANNVKRCPDCRKARVKAKRNTRHRQKRGALYGMRDRHQPMSDATRFNIMMAGAMRNARCSRCHKHMKKCKCVNRHTSEYSLPEIETWRPWAMPLPKM